MSGHKKTKHSSSSSSSSSSPKVKVNKKGGPANLSGKAEMSAGSISRGGRKDAWSISGNARGKPSV